MAVREVLRYPHPLLKSRAAIVEPGAHAVALATDLVDTMRASPACVGLAAPQVGADARAFCLDVSGHRRARTSSGLVVMLNPSVAETDGRDVIREGCMSLPEFTANVARATRVVVDGFAPGGEPMRIEAFGFEARAMLHEIDHLDGLLFLDRVSSLAGDVFPRKRYVR